MLIITKDALKILAANNASCKVFGEKKIKNLQYLTQLARQEIDFDFDELVRNLPEKGIMYGSIKTFATYLGKDVIDQEVMLKFLGGSWHIDYVQDQTTIIGSLGEDFHNNFLFSHILLVGELTEVGEKNSAVYTNGNVRVQINGLVKHPFFASELVVGQKVLIHQALILEVEPSLSVQEELQVQQSSSHKFMEIAGKIKSIDYEKFWNIKEWTENVVSEL